MVDHASLPFGSGRHQHLGDDLLQRIGVRFDRAGQRIAAQRAEAHLLHLRHFALAQRQALVVDQDQRAIALHHRTLRGEVQRRHRDLLAVDVQPDVELGPVRNRKHAHRFALVDAGVVEVPQLRALVLGIPAVLLAAEREDALLGARLLLVAARAADRRVEAVLIQRLLQRLGLHHVGMHGGAVADRADALGDAFGIGVHVQR